jgi:hypothetical protein
MSDQGHNKRPLNPPGLDPLSPGAKHPSRQYKDDIDERTWHYGIIAVAFIFAVALVGAVIWFANSDQETATNPPPTTTGDRRARHPSPTDPKEIVTCRGTNMQDPGSGILSSQTR